MPAAEQLRLDVGAPGLLTHEGLGLPERRFPSSCPSWNDRRRSRRDRLLPRRRLVLVAGQPGGRTLTSLDRVRTPARRPFLMIQSRQSTRQRRRRVNA